MKHRVRVETEICSIYIHIYIDIISKAEDVLRGSHLHIQLETPYLRTRPYIYNTCFIPQFTHKCNLLENICITEPKVIINNKDKLKGQCRYFDQGIQR